MTRRIFRTVFFVAVSMFVASVALFMTVLYGYFSVVRQEELRSQTDLAARGVENGGLRYLEGLGSLDCRITWIGEDGGILYDSRSDAGGMENHLEREEVREALEDGYGMAARSSFTLAERYLYSAKRLEDGTVLRISAAQDSLPALFLGMSEPFCVIFAAAVCLSFFLASRLAKKIVKPLNELDLDAPFADGVYEELSPLLVRIQAQQKEIGWQREELLQTSKLRREFTANVSHELKTPLQTISGSAELLAGGMVRPEDVPAFSGRIYGEAKRMIGLVEDILRLSHLDEGAEDMKWEWVDLYALGEEAAELFSSGARAAGVAFLFLGGPAAVFGIRPLLQGIIYNLCDNAVKYNRPGGSVSLEIREEAGEAVLMVKDTGIGIPPEYQERIFERFYRVDKSHSKEIGGTGLGLSIVKHAVNLHGAKLELSSVPGKGTEISVRFPKRGEGKKNGDGKAVWGAQALSDRRDHGSGKDHGL
ncbi:MAG: PAS domain-containing sensor histidine kinase [Lachnospiraceae bacterium]|nr:PAS domain-containing sensor histidine kinase [Lachnospiraceae bacterium]